MSLTVSDLGDCKFSVHVEFSSEKIAEKKTEVLSEFRKLPVPGHRPGKASLDVIKFRYKTQIQARLREALAEAAYHEAVQENNFKTLGQPHFTDVRLDDTFVCDFTLATRPTVTLGQYRDFELPKPATQVTVQEFSESLLQELRGRNGETVPYTADDFVQKGDSVIVDYTATIDGQPVQELTAKKEVLTIGQSPLQLFDDNLLGMKMGDVRTFDVAAPEGASAAYAGKTLSFTVTLAMGSKSTPAALDDELAKRLNMEDLAALQQHVAGIAETRVRAHEQTALEQQVSLRLVEGHDIAVPNWLSLKEAQISAQRQQLNWDELEDVRKEEMLSAAEKSIKISLILESVREVEPEAQLSNEEVNQYLYQDLQKLTKSPDPQNVENVFQHLSNNGMLPVLVGKIRDEYTLAFLTKTCKITE